MASFMRKDTRKGRKRVKIKIFVTGISLPICNRELKKKQKKIKKINKHRYGLLPSEPRLGKAEKELKKKNYRFDHFLPEPKQRIEKRIVKKFKKLKNTIIASFQAKTGWERSRNGENKNYRSDHFLTDP